jgi:pantoate--beta-alanine ligase
MIIVRTMHEMRKLSSTWRKEDKRIGFVPTMGALHNGHISLVRLTASQSDRTVMSIFVNPTQFGPAEDFDRYPRPFEQDCAAARAAGCDALFAPDKNEIYPENHRTSVSVDSITAKLEGALRPDHFRGVTTVVCKLLNIVAPHIAVFGQKDAQQVIVLKRMVRDLFMPVDLIVGPTLRESDGLAMSSRNVYLTPAERAEAPMIYQSLRQAATLFSHGERSTETLRSAVNEILCSAESFKPQYIAVVDTISLDDISTIASAALIAVACKMRGSGTRLIDNIVVGGGL